MPLRRLLLDPRLDGMRLRFAVVVTVFATLIAYVALLDGIAARHAASEAGAGHEGHGARSGQNGAAAQAALAAATPARNSYHETATQSGWAAGHFAGTAASDGLLRVGSPTGTVTVNDKAYDYGSWQSPWVTPGFGFAELVPSWNAKTPMSTYLSVQVRAKTTDGRLTTWQSFGRWTTLDFARYRRSVAGNQSDGLSTVATDTLRAASGVSFASYSLRIRVMRREGTTATPAVRALGATVSQLASSVPPTSKPYLPAKSLAVPEYSQMIHRGQYPEYGGGGQAWCSPTSLSMVLAYYGARPTASEYAWVDDAYADPWVDEVARRVFDFEYDGAGNWPFNTAYAGHRVARAAVLRLNSLRGAEKFIAAGIPLIASISFSSGQLTGAPISSTAGHLVVISGFTSAGNVIVNDPAASSDSTVRRVYKRSEFERVWQQKSHGLVYAIRDAKHTFPTGYGLH